MTIIESSLAPLPPHDADRWESVDGTDERGHTNGERADLARREISVRLHHTDDESNFSDLITNLLHLAHSKGMDPAEILQDATTNFYMEAGAL